MALPPVPNACIACGVSAWHHASAGHAYQAPTPGERSARMDSWINLNSKEN